MSRPHTTHCILPRFFCYRNSPRLWGGGKLGGRNAFAHFLDLCFKLNLVEGVPAPKPNRRQKSDERRGLRPDEDWGDDFDRFNHGIAKKYFMVDRVFGWIFAFMGLVVRLVDGDPMSPWASASPKLVGHLWRRLPPSWKNLHIAYQRSCKAML